MGGKCITQAKAFLLPRCMHNVTTEENMIKKLTKHGNSYALVIDRGIMDHLNIDEKTDIHISTNG